MTEVALKYTTQEAIEDYVTCLRTTYTTGKSRDAYARTFFLERLYALVKDNEEKFYNALALDLNKSRSDSLASEISPVLEEIAFFLKNYDQLTKDKRVKTRFSPNYTDTAFIRREALGVVLIISTWNYPLQLSLVPLAGALAAGNCAVLKLSEVSVHTSNLIAELLPQYIDSTMYRVVQGGPEETQHLLQQKFDHIFYTGNSNVAKLVMKAASEQLTPVTLELGGKSAALVDSNVDMQVVANRVAYGKFFNCGQSCVAVDYVLVPQERLNDFVKAVRNTVNKWYGADPSKSADYGRIVTTRHFDRLLHLLNNRETGNIVFGGQTDRYQRYFAPTLVTGVNFNDKVLMSEEIFGPILPVITYTDMEAAMGLINKNEPALALYLFSKKRSVVERVLAFTKSGGVTVNDTLMHQNEYALPFGGVGSSGMGGYHGEKSFQTFSHERSILVKKQRFEWLLNTRYPPSSAIKLMVLRAMLLTTPVRMFFIVYKRSVKYATVIILALLYLLKRNL